MYKRHTSAALVLSAALLVGPAYAQSDPSDQKAAQGTGAKNADTCDTAEVKSLEELLIKEEIRRSKWESTVSASFNGDEAGDQSRYELGTDGEVYKGKYPGQLRFTVGSQITLKDRKLEDEVSSLLLNYDYYVK
ncbi:MAG: hypothetical protein JSW34_05580, partial [Candidatus Zixiibacteriota bacterium]